MELDSFSDDKAIDEEEEELRQLQQHLAASSAEIDHAMEESRRKLDTLLQPPPASSSSEVRRRRIQMDSQQQVEPLAPTAAFTANMLLDDILIRTNSMAATSAATTRTNNPQQHDAGTYNRTPTFIDTDGSFTQEMTRHRYPHKQRSQDEPRREAQSALYKKWRHDRAQKIAQLASARDQHTLREAQQSMQLFHQTLASFQSQQQ